MEPERATEEVGEPPDILNVQNDAGQRPSRSCVRESRVRHIILLGAARILIDRLADDDTNVDHPATEFPAPPLREVVMNPDQPQLLDIVTARLCNSRFHDVDLSATAFRDVKLAGATFGDVNLSGAEFDDVRFRMARFTDTDFTDASIVTSNLTGMRIDGVLVSELFDAYRATRT